MFIDVPTAKLVPATISNPIKRSMAMLLAVQHGSQLCLHVVKDDGRIPKGSPCTSVSSATSLKQAIG